MASLQQPSPQPEPKIFSPGPVHILAGIVLVLTPLVYMVIQGPKGNGASSATISQADSHIFDVPSLVGKDINGIKAILGTPQEEEPQSTLPANALWKRGTTELYIEYEQSTGRVLDLFLPLRPSDSASDTQPLVNAGGLIRNSPIYRVEDVAAIGTPGEYTGIKVHPQ